MQILSSLCTLPSEISSIRWPNYLGHRDQWEARRESLRRTGVSAVRLGSACHHAVVGYTNYSRVCWAVFGQCAGSTVLRDVVLHAARDTGSIWSQALVTKWGWGDKAMCVKKQSVLPCDPCKVIAWCCFKYNMIQHK